MKNRAGNPSRSDRLPARCISPLLRGVQAFAETGERGTKIPDMPRIGGVQGWILYRLSASVIHPPASSPDGKKPRDKVGTDSRIATCTIPPCCCLACRCIGVVWGAAGFGHNASSEPIKRQAPGKWGGGIRKACRTIFFRQKGGFFYLGKLGVFNLIKLDFQNLRKLEVCERGSIRSCGNTCPLGLFNPQGY